jgi:dihydroorotase
MLSSYLFKNANILDVYTGKYDKKDILVEDRVITQIDKAINKKTQAVIDAQGLIVTPGWMDTHAHLYYDHDCIGIDPQIYWIAEGVTYGIDQGSAGADNYENYREYVLYNTDIKFKSFLNISRIGMPIVMYDLTKLSNVDKEACYKIYRKYADELVGLKLRITTVMCEDSKKALELVTEMANELKVPFSLHETRVETLKAEEIFPYLRKGDYLQHSYAKSVSGILDEKGKVRACVWDAKKRGVFFDMGHGINSLDFNVAKAALDQGFELDCISSDLHCAGMAGPVFDLATSISKFIALGYSVEKAMYMVTAAPTQMMGVKDKSNTIKVGEKADFTAFEVESGKFVFKDSTGNELKSDKRIKVRYTAVNDKVFTPRKVKATENEPIGNKAKALQK